MDNQVACIIASATALAQSYILRLLGVSCSYRTTKSKILASNLLLSNSINRKQCILCQV
jgi:hypothetical protein